MEALTWDASFLTGISTVDVQHEHLVRLINDFGNLTARTVAVPRQELEAVVEELIRYAHTHFVDEEAYMREAGLDPRYQTQHEGQHARFLRDVSHMQAANFLEAAETSQVLFRFLLHWLAFHILGSDMQLARQAERVRRGEAPADALAAEVHEEKGPTQLLLGALDDLMRVVAQRNAELTEANRTLEQRVAERTAELRASIDALRATQVQLLEAEKLASVGQLASGLAHEINNPLAFISSNLKALEDHTAALLEVVDAVQSMAPELPGAARARLEAARDEADLDFVREDLAALLTQTRSGVTRVQAIVRDLKDFSRVDGSSLIDLDVKSAVEAALKVLPAKRREGVALVTDFGLVPRVRCQAAQVNHALLNLVQNATQAVQDRLDHTGTVTVRTGIEGASVFVEVADTGVGMAPEVLAHAFEPFYTTRPPGQGMGLGLSTAYNCAQSHGGRLEARSRVGEGSTFRLVLPLQRRVDEPAKLTNDFNTRRYTTPVPGK
jgi:two-component system, NtrC family, sensor kinase